MGFTDVVWIVGFACLFVLLGDRFGFLFGLN